MYKLSIRVSKKRILDLKNFAFTMALSDLIIRVSIWKIKNNNVQNLIELINKHFISSILAVLSQLRVPTKTHSTSSTECLYWNFDFIW